MKTSIEPRSHKKHRLVSIDELGRIAAREPIGWLVHKILPSVGVCVVGGNPQAGKTTLLAVAAARISRGRKVGRHKTEQGTVVWLSLEHTDSDSHTNLSLALKGAAKASRRRLVALPLGSNWTLDSPEDIAWLRGKLDRLGAKVVIIDSLRRASSFEENSSGDMRSVMERLEELTSKNQRLVVATHHLGKNGTMRGSTHLEAAVRTSIRLTRLANDHIRLECRHHAAAEYRCHFKIDRTRHRLRLLSRADPKTAAKFTRTRTRTKAIRSAIKRVLKALGPLSWSRVRAEVRKEQPCGNAAIDNHLQQMLHAGVLKKEQGPKNATLYSLA